MRVLSTPLLDQGILCRASASALMVTLAVDCALGPTRSLRPATFCDDEGFAKPRAEVLLEGSVGVEAGAPRVVRLRAGVIDKRVAVFGHRFWRGNGSVDGGGLVDVPLAWPSAFGGLGYASNPLGKGIAADDQGIVRLPNIEDPRHLLTSPNDRPPPIGFGAIEVTRVLRQAKLGTYDDRWLDDRWPDFPSDLDPTYFNVASADQWLPDGQWWRGDETIRVEGMRSDGAVLECALPRVRARCFVNRREAAAERFHEVPMHLETLVVLPNIERVVLLFRGVTPCASDDADDILHLLAALEDFREPKAFDHYKAAFETRLDRRAAARLRGEDLLPSWAPPHEFFAEGSAPERLGLMKSDDLMRANFRRRAETELASARERLTAEGIDPDAHGVSAALPPPFDELDDEAAEKLLADAEAEVEDLKAKADAMMEAETARARQLCAESGVDFDQKLADSKKGQGGPPKWKPADVLDPLASAAELCRNAEIPDEENKALQKLRDPELHAQLADMREKLVAMYRSFAHHFPAASMLEGEAVHALRAEVQTDWAAKRSFAQRDLTGADLSRLDLSGADFREALLEKADLHGANLEGADLTGAVLTRADLEGARTKGIRLAGANLAEARLSKLDLSGVDLRQTVLVGTELGGADLRGANLDGAELAEANLARADLSGASARQARFTSARVDGTQFVGADLTKATFQSQDLSGLDFSNAKLKQADFVDCRGEKTSFVGADLTNARFAHIKSRSCFDGANFESANLSHANLRDIDLKGAHFALATLDDCDLSKADCEGANFYRVSAKSSLWMRTNLKGARLAGANLRDAMMKNANVSGASLRGANLFSANLLFVKVDGATDIDGAELGQIAFRKAREV